MKFKCVIEYEYPVEHKPPVKAEIVLHGDRVTTDKIVPYKDRPHGEWIDYEDAEYSYLANCSKCGYQMNTHEEHGYFNFCPKCGSDNRKRGDEK